MSYRNCPELSGIVRTGRLYMSGMSGNTIRVPDTGQKPDSQEEAIREIPSEQAKVVFEGRGSLKVTTYRAWLEISGQLPARVDAESNDSQTNHRKSLIAQASHFPAQIVVPIWLELHRSCPRNV